VDEPLDPVRILVDEELANSRSMMVWIVGRVGPGASPTPTRPSSVNTSTMSPEADSLIPPVHLSGALSGVRTAVVWIRVTLKPATLGRLTGIVNHP